MNICKFKSYLKEYTYIMYIVHYISFQKTCWFRNQNLNSGIFHFFIKKFSLYLHIILLTIKILNFSECAFLLFPNSISLRLHIERSMQNTITNPVCTLNILLDKLIFKTPYWFINNVHFKHMIYIYINWFNAS